ncbi:ABC transporter ATP-binding protein [Candidatus Sumerlaeota bacterium]|nr:ABC transporter ATP-binding protein [Candidatus Sumerlaeota bacterium]
MSKAAEIREQRYERFREEDREALVKKGDFSQMRRLLRYLRPRRRQVATAIALSLVIAILTPAPMVIVKFAIDNFIQHHKIDGLVFSAIALIVSQLIIFFLDRRSQYLIAEIGQFTMRDLRLEVFNHIQSQSLRFFDRNPVGRLITRITSDVNVLNEMFAQGVVGIFQQIFSLFVILCVLLWFNWQLTLWVMLVLPVIAIASWNFRNNVFVSYRLTRVRLSRLNTFMQENITGMRTVQANGRESSQFETFDHLNASHRDAHIQTVFQYALFFPIVEVVTTVGMGIVLYKGGMHYVSAGAAAAVTVGQLALFIQALEKFFQPIKDLSEKYNVVQSAIAASERLFALLDSKPNLIDPPKPQEVKPFGNSIQFKDVWFAYNPGEWVLRGVSFTVQKGQTIAVVGPTGSGKTTLMSLLCRFYDIQKGEILVDGIDIREMRISDLRSKIAIVMQDVFLFFGTVVENIRLGNCEITDERVQHVAQQTGFADFVERFPKRYDTGVRERGATLSTGQKQLLSFTRALAFDPEILILDEATANIDTESEERLQQAVATLCAGRTSIVIAHRLSTIQNADRIIVIHHGHLIEEGTHEELLARDGMYRKLYELQYKEGLAV